MTVNIICADVLEGLAKLPDQSVHCVVTSPPYWGLRNYSTATWEGGDPECYHTGHAQEPWPRGVCGICGATSSNRQLGLESSFTEHLEALRSVFAEVRRVLRNDGTLWLNYGDAYASRKGEFKPKDLMLMPARVAISLQEAGWWVRSEIVWHKPNAAPQSASDRPTQSHDKLFLLTKSGSYFYDQAAVRTRSVKVDESRHSKPSSWATSERYHGQSPRETKRVTDVDWAYKPSRTANLRDVWSIPAPGFRSAHFATFPTALVEPCIKAGTSGHGCCATCGAPWRRVVEHAKGYSWEPTCNHQSGVLPCTVLDPFGGAGTVGLVADRLGRHAQLIELHPAYVELARDRILADAPMFADVEVQL